jgi:hypothetical protein
MKNTGKFMMSIGVKCRVFAAERFLHLKIIVSPAISKATLHISGAAYKAPQATSL